MLRLLAAVSRRTAIEMSGNECQPLRPVLAVSASPKGRRIAVLQASRSELPGRFSDLSLFYDLQRVVDFDPQVADRALQPMDCWT